MKKLLIIILALLIAVAAWAEPLKIQSTDCEVLFSFSNPELTSVCITQKDVNEMSKDELDALAIGLKLIAMVSYRDDGGALMWELGEIYLPKFFKKESEK